ncbi:S-layer homology domain-containing protein [Planococcus sp. 4-30]|uniref:S-layer homology domain-containing protein n=1 Tax=Planococcus sp. 4-30 TaxID=2874583 RepID=UPI001CBC4A07|nr:S-layer homology domain-containing protein [Planococcus sp. 4-30]
MKFIEKNLTVWVISFAFLSFIFFSYSVAVFAEEKVSIISFGANNDGKTNQTGFIQEAINSQSEQGGGRVFFPKGTYLIDAVKSIVLKDNITLEFEKGAVLKALPNSEEHYQILRIHDVNNVNIVGAAEIVGERQEHQGKAGEWGFGISIKGSNNIVIENVKVSNCWGDGIYIGSTANQRFNENIKITNPVLNNNRRQGISVISAINLYISNAVITNTNGTPPQSGIDIEPNSSIEQIKNINISNLSTENNNGYGLIVSLKQLKGSAEPVSIYVDTIKNVKDRYVVAGIEGLKGEINIGGYYYLTDKEIVSKPKVNVITATSTNLIGTAPSGSTVGVKSGKTLVATGVTKSTGEFTVVIPKQKAGTVLSVTATDKAGNISKETQVTVKAETFSDVQTSHWFYDEVLYLSEKKIVAGFLNGTFQPNKKTTRAEAAKMLAIALNISSSTKKTEYSDINSDHWAENDIAAVTEAGLFNGYANGSFKPDKNITRAEMAQVLALAYKFEANNTQVFKDVPTSHWASKPISGLVQNKITYGYSDKTFRPGQAITRAEFSVFLARALNKDFR